MRARIAGAETSSSQRLVKRLNRVLTNDPGTGIARRPDEGPLSFEERVRQSRPDLEGIVGAFMRLYVALRYAGEAGPQNVARLQQLAKDFKP